ncbi:hypothetical protein HPB48_013026 [Haemaphysalis longicornis]|uniref:Uncharacterized protein n=1 Tax=Haemaphysalis longicornis TaxID=44386 RepID=A0A9J6GQ70_HAELO|nr:hypothetical protein HPB48_013026 [Haemaphysalis longicornis]
MDTEITAQTTEGLECGKNPLQRILDAVQLMAEQMNAFQKFLLEDRAASALRITNLEASVDHVVLTQRTAKRATPCNKPELATLAHQSFENPSTVILLTHQGTSAIALGMAEKRRS